MTELDKKMKELLKKRAEVGEKILKYQDLEAEVRERILKYQDLREKLTAEINVVSISIMTKQMERSKPM